VPLTGEYFPSYDVTILGDPIPFGTVKPGESAESKTLPKRNGKDPTDYLVSAAGSAATQTTLAFLGTVEDAPGISELELASMTELLLGDGSFLVPMLRDPDGLLPLFVFVDLLQWIEAGATFDPLQSFSLVEGISDLLPGFFVSTSPITLNADGSFQGAAFIGAAVAAAGIDGRALEVAEPSTISITALSFLVLLLRKFLHRQARPNA
jgi:hypothetical protein